MNDNPSKQDSETDWARLDQMTDADIDFSDQPELTAAQISRGTLRLPKDCVLLWSIISPEMNRWLDSTGEPRIDVVDRALREYRERHPQSA